MSIILQGINIFSCPVVGQATVGNDCAHRLAVGDQRHVAGFQIAMHDHTPVGLVERSGQPIVNESWNADVIMESPLAEVARS